jgi:hypothetical protein
MNPHVFSLRSGQTDLKGRTGFGAGLVASGRMCSMKLSEVSVSVHLR